jgi:hypothetical protein
MSQIRIILEQLQVSPTENRILQGSGHNSIVLRGGGCGSIPQAS